MIRQGTPQDVPALARLRAAWTAEAAMEPEVPEPAEEFTEAFRGWLAANPRTFFVAEADADHALIGMLNLSIFERMPKPGKPVSVWVYLANAYVLPAYRNAGVGSGLLSAAVDYARGIGAVRMVTSPSHASKNFYARHGFEPAEELAVYRL